jgi:hypothetical protein
LSALPTWPEPGLYVHPETGAPTEFDGTTWATDWSLIDLSILPDRPPLIPDLAPGGAVSLLYTGKRHVFSGPPESVKTLLAYCQLLFAHRAGRRVLIIDLETDRYDARDLLRYLGATTDELRAIHYVNPETAPDAADMERLLAQQYDLVLLDAAAGAYA